MTREYLEARLEEAEWLATQYNGRKAGQWRRVVQQLRKMINNIKES